MRMLFEEQSYDFLSPFSSGFSRSRSGSRNGNGNPTARRDNIFSFFPANARLTNVVKNGIVQSVDVQIAPAPNATKSVNSSLNNQRPEHWQSQRKNISEEEDTEPETDSDEDTHVNEMSEPEKIIFAQVPEDCELETPTPSKIKQAEDSEQKLSMMDLNFLAAGSGSRTAQALTLPYLHVDSRNKSKGILTIKHLQSVRVEVIHLSSKGDALINDGKKVMMIPSRQVSIVDKSDELNEGKKRLEFVKNLYNTVLLDQVVDTAAVYLEIQKWLL